MDFSSDQVVFQSIYVTYSGFEDTFAYLCYRRIKNLRYCKLEFPAFVVWCACDEWTDRKAHRGVKSSGNHSEFRWVIRYFA